MKEKWVQINKIEGYENVKEYYWISNTDEDVVINRDTGKQLKICLDNYGYKMVNLYTTDGKQKNCRIHVMKAKAFLFGPNPLGANVVRHLNDVRTDNRLENLAWGSYSDNMQDSIKNRKFNYEAAVKNCAKGGKITGAKNGKRSSKPVKCLETGVIYPSTRDAGRKLGISNAGISFCCLGKRQTSGGYHFEFVDSDE